MKKIKYLLLSLPLLLLGSCNGDMGTEPGTDPNAAVTMFAYEPDEESGLNPDNDVIVRLATNNATTAVYYLAELTADVEAYKAANGGEEAYIAKVLAEGTKTDVNGAENVDLTFTDLHGQYTFTAVATGKGDNFKAETTFLGADWTEITPGTSIWNFALCPDAVTKLMVCDQDETRYRIQNAFGEGQNFEFYKMDKTGSDEYGNFTLLRVYPQSTGQWYQMSDWEGPRVFNTMDVASWQASASNATDSGYMSVMYEDNTCIFNLAWCVVDPSTRKWVCYGYGINGGGADYPSSYFIPD